jgi:uncharacterized protein
MSIAIKQEQSFPAPPEAVLRALLDPNVLKFCIPKCRDVRRVTPNQFRVAADIGVLKLTYRFDGLIDLAPNADETGYDVSATVSIGRIKLGNVTGYVQVAGGPGGSQLSGSVEINPARKFGPVITKMMQPLASSLVGSFFNRFEIAVSEMDLDD